mmetsp:Transcript_24729/g.37584  ORF Transcript_24729/g.37584 Transcript_24729/m.37584 type:complete len:160 (+) Transcript_24729:86-565(+)
MFSYHAAPEENHILCGRGAKNYNHTGNMRFRQLVEREVPSYMKSSSKKTKATVIEKVMSNIQSEDLIFVEYNCKESCWEKLSNTASRKKVAHRFRDFARKETNNKLFETTASTISTNSEFQRIISQVKENAIAHERQESEKMSFEPITLSECFIEVFSI